MSLCNHTCYAFMSLWRLVTSNGVQYYACKKSNFCLPNKGLIPLDLHTQRFGRTKTWFRWKNNNQAYLCLQKWSTRSVNSNFRTEFEINPLESDFYRPTPLPSGISWASDLPTPYKFPIPSMVGVWIFSGTTQYILNATRILFSTDFGFILVKLVNSVWQNFSKKQLKVVG